MQLEQFLNEFATAFYRRSEMMFDNLGIHISSKSLNSYYDKEKAKKAFLGTSWLSRLWCSKLRPILRPKQHDVIYNELVKQVAALKQEYLLAVLERGTEIAKELKENADAC
jgi:hypothetical protein